MNILHISNDFSGSKVHVNLYKELSKQGVKQMIYCPVRSAEQIGGNEFVADGTEVIYDFVIQPYHKYVYHIKRINMFRSLQKKVNLKEIDLVHAATLFSDGGQAYKIYKKYHIPYVVAVRNTDINGFLDLLPNTWPAGKKILRNAEKIFFISNALMNKFSNHKVIKAILPEINDKMMLVPNGIDDYYLDHVNYETRDGNKVLYVGDFSSNKNVLRLCEAIMELRQEDAFRDVTLTLIGGGKNTNNEVQTKIDTHPDVFLYLGPIYDKEKLCDIFKTHSVFAMPSIHETFGLVYLEALSQNLPIVYTKGQGVDGLFDDSVGIGVNPLLVTEIKNAIKTILNSKNQFSNNSIDFEQFRWTNIATKYMNLYKEILK